MPIMIRPAEAADAAQCGAILYSAFQRLADDHNFPRDFPSVEVATGLVSMLLTNPSFYGIVAEENGRIVGSNFADHRSSIAGIGPISIDPEAQNQGIGRKLMQAAIDHFKATRVRARRRVARGNQCADRNGRRTSWTDHGIRYRHRFFRPCRRRDKSGLKIADRRSVGISGTGISAPDAKSRGFLVVPRKRVEASDANDTNEHRPLQRAGGSVVAVGSVMI
jgi:predicted N-acetyltransferase YhbS